MYGLVLSHDFQKTFGIVIDIYRNFVFNNSQLLLKIRAWELGIDNGYY